MQELSQLRLQELPAQGHQLLQTWLLYTQDNKAFSTISQGLMFFFSSSDAGILLQDLTRLFIHFRVIEVTEVDLDSAPRLEVSPVRQIPLTFHSTFIIFDLTLA